MEDRFKFRGQDLEGNTLRYGQLTIIEAENIHPPKGYYISNKSNMPYAYPIKPQTVGQCTGLKDKNGKLIYEGDIILTQSEPIIKKWTVSFDNGKFILFNGLNSNRDIDNASDYDIVNNCYVNDVQVIGNIHQNKDLLNA